MLSDILSNFLVVAKVFIAETAVLYPCYLLPANLTYRELRPVAVFGGVFVCPVPHSVGECVVPHCPQLVHVVGHGLCLVVDGLKPLISIHVPREGHGFMFGALCIVNGGTLILKSPYPLVKLCCINLGFCRI